MATTLTRLWKREELPIYDALSLCDGRAFAVELDELVPGGLKVNDPLTSTRCSAKVRGG